MAAPASTNEEQSATFKLTKLKKKGTGDAHLGSITCVDWTAALPNRLMSGSEVLSVSQIQILLSEKGILISMIKSVESLECQSHFIKFQISNQFSIGQIHQSLGYPHSTKWNHTRSDDKR